MNANMILIKVSSMLSVDIDVFFNCTFALCASASSSSCSVTCEIGSSMIDGLRLPSRVGRSVASSDATFSLMTALSFSVRLRRKSAHPFSGNPAYEYLNHFINKLPLYLNISAYSINTESRESTTVIPAVNRNCIL